MYNRGMRLGLFITLAVALPLAVSAQTLDAVGGAVGSSFTVSVNPQYPAPYSQATLSFTSSSIELANATLKVSVGGKSVYQGSVQPVAVTLGRAGSVASVVATVTSHGSTYTQSLSIQPEDVSLIAEPISSAPVLYRGKPLASPEGSVRVVAVANLRGASGKTSDPTTLSYSWTVDGTRITDSSGIGKTAVIVASPMQYRTRSVSVVVTSQDGVLVGGDTLSLTATEPSVRVYENDPLLGIRFERALGGGYAIKGSESTLYAVPFSFPTLNGAPSLQWFLNGNAAQTGASITLRPAGGGEGSASLSVVASAESTTVTTGLSISFGTPASSNFFGL